MSGRDSEAEGDRAEPIESVERADSSYSVERTDSSDPLERWAGTIMFALAVLVASLIPVRWVAPGDGGGAGDSVNAMRDALPVEVGLTDPFHLVGYAVLTVLASRVVGRGRRGLLLAAVAAVAFGFAIELVQASVPWRSFAWGDVAVNAVGAAVGLVAVVAVDAVGSTGAGGGRRSR